jgi:hypothetical protein
MYALWKTQGTRIAPWRADVCFGAARDRDTVYVVIHAEQPWSGLLAFDQPRHETVMHLPFDYARINQFPEWFTVDQDARYVVKIGRGNEFDQPGGRLVEGLPLKLRAGETRLVQVRQR